MRPRLALVNASFDENTPRNFRRELDADLAEFDVTAGTLPPDFAFDGVVVTGSRTSVYDETEEWIPPVLDWLARADDRGLPILGVCWGHQALAAALGGRVEYMGEYELGYREVSHDGDDLFAGVDDPLVAFTSHQDAVVELPPDADRIASNEYGNHGFRRGDAWGVQFHPEYDAETARSVARGKEDSVGADRLESVLAGVTEENYAAACETKRLFDNFLAAVERVRADEASAAD
jgi:GMP synthase (glutamine-hydrolysing)